MSETTTYLKMDDVDDEQRKEYDRNAYRRDTIAMTVLLIMVAITIALAVIMAGVELGYITYGQDVAFTWGV